MIKRSILIAAAALALSASAAFAQDTVGGRTDYEAVAASQSDQVCGPVGGSGDVLERLIISVATAATGTVSIKDGGGSAIVITAANTPIGVYTVYIGARSTAGAWKITTGAGATAICVGRFK
jgi:hypothetical protein